LQLAVFWGKTHGPEVKSLKSQQSVKLGAWRDQVRQWALVPERQPVVTVDPRQYPGEHSVSAYDPREWARREQAPRQADVSGAGRVAARLKTAGRRMKGEDRLILGVIYIVEWERAVLARQVLPGPATRPGAFWGGTQATLWAAGPSAGGLRTDAQGQQSRCYMNNGGLYYRKKSNINAAGAFSAPMRAQSPVS